MASFDATALIHLWSQMPRRSLIPRPAIQSLMPRRGSTTWSRHWSRSTNGSSYPPALTEVLVHADDAMPSYLEVLNNAARFRIVPFDQRAAIELGAIVRDGPSIQDLRVGTSSTRASLKFDRQILAIARVEGESTIYSDDTDMPNWATPWASR